MPGLLADLMHTHGGIALFIPTCMWRLLPRPLYAAASPPAGERRAVRRGQEGENGLE